MQRSQTFIAIPPGETIKEQLIERKMKQKEFAARLGVSEKHVSKLINGEVQLTIEMARKLEMVLGVPTQFWCSLEAIYREDIAKIKEENAMDEDIVIVNNMPYDEMVQNGWVVNVVKKTEQVIHLRKYFELAELKYLQTTFAPTIACRKLSEKKKDDCALIAWAQKAKLEARDIATKPIHVDKIMENIPRIQELLKQEQGDFFNQLKEILADCGVAIVFLPAMKEFDLYGATFIDNDKIVMGLAICEEEREEFAFSLFHELAHIIYGHVGKTEGTSEEDEKCAEEFARKHISANA